MLNSVNKILKTYSHDTSKYKYIGYVIQHDILIVYSRSKKHDKIIKTRYALSALRDC